MTKQNTVLKGNVVLRKNTAIAIAIIFAIVLVVTFSAFYVGQNVDHQCSQDNCTICEQIRICENAVHMLVFLVLAITASTVADTCYKDVCNAKSWIYTHSTPVSLKVKLSN